LHDDPRVDRGTNQREPRIADEGGPGVADEGEVLALAEQVHELLGPFLLDPLVEARVERSLDPVVFEDPAGRARILGDHEVDGSKRLDRP
jgi:hypothetical protein